MKKFIKNILLSTAALVLLSGCTSQPNTFKTYAIKGNDVMIVILAGSMEVSSSDTELEVQNSAILIKEAARAFKQHNMKYFTLGAGKVPPMITNVKDLVSYCYPTYKNDTSLEEKCDLAPTFNNSYVRFTFTGTKKRKEALNSFVWSVEEVLSDPYTDKIIDEALESYDKKIFRYKKDTRVIKYLKKNS
jgi:hypothetical protein